jgi:hypothetical protein
MTFAEVGLWSGAIVAAGSLITAIGAAIYYALTEGCAS